ncbi:MAG TPA: hypothetical protein VEA99_11500, partial [Gemmatimonadaceae bacterium]|nr:hypothetical protein [Gemmatimonadaceae bacterium]
RVRDPASDPAARVDETEARLDGCSLTEDRRYRCGVTLFDYPHRMPREHPRDRAYYRALAQRARRDVLTLHLQAYFPDDASADAPVRRPPD